MILSKVIFDQKIRIAFLAVFLGCFLMLNSCADKPGKSTVVAAADGDKSVETKGPVSFEDAVKEVDAEAENKEGEEPAAADKSTESEAPVSFAEAVKEVSEEIIAAEAEETSGEPGTEDEIKKVEEDEEAAQLAAKENEERIAATAEADRLAAEEEAKRLAEEEEKRKLAIKEAKIYDVDVGKLTTKDCLRCHISQYTRIVEKGGKHQGVVCTDCHREFHAYNPRKENYKDIMPKCFWCHDDPHGSERVVLRCLNCHKDPHQPLGSIPDPAQLEQNCQICHGDIAALLQGSPSKHTQQECSSCHSEKHGRIPECSACHKNHSPKVEMKTADCLACHPVHTPLKITYPQTQSKELCGGCHEKPYQDLAERVTKHSALTCAKCHSEHGKLPECQDCHGEAVHDVRIHQRFKACGECHGIAHKLDK